MLSCPSGSLSSGLIKALGVFIYIIRRSVLRFLSAHVFRPESGLRASEINNRRRIDIALDIIAVSLPQQLVVIVIAIIPEIAWIHCREAAQVSPWHKHDGLSVDWIAKQGEGSIYPSALRRVKQSAIGLQRMKGDSVTFANHSRVLRQAMPYEISRCVANPIRANSFLEYLHFLEVR